VFSGKLQVFSAYCIANASWRWRSDGSRLKLLNVLNVLMLISLVGALCSVTRFRYCQLQKRQTPDTRAFCWPCAAGRGVAHHTCRNIDAPWFISHAVVTLSSRYVTACWLQDHRHLPFVSSFKYCVTCFQSASLYGRRFGPSALVTVGRRVDWWYCTCP